MQDKKVIDESRDEIENLCDVPDARSDSKPQSNQPTKVVALSPKVDDASHHQEYASESYNAAVEQDQAEVVIKGSLQTGI